MASGSRISVSPALSKTQALERRILPKHCWRNWSWPCTSAHKLAAAEIHSQGAALDWGSSPAATSHAKPPLLQLIATLPDEIPENSQWVKGTEERSGVQTQLCLTVTWGGSLWKATATKEHHAHLGQISSLAGPQLLTCCLLSAWKQECHIKGSSNSCWFSF